MNPPPLPRHFYERPTLQVAPALLGKLLVRRTEGQTLIGKIVEVEAYRGADDPASHAYKGRSPRNAVMFGPPGVAYIYFTYGNHFCLNIKTEPEGEPAAVLLRALEPLTGLELMQHHRGTNNLLNLTSGPGKLTKAFGITREHNGTDLVTNPDFYVAEAQDRKAAQIVTTTRIGIRAARDRPWRFYLAGNPHVSRK